MNQKKSFQIFELSNRIIRSEYSLHSFLAWIFLFSSKNDRNTWYSDANVGCLDHRNIIGSVSDGKSDSFFVSFHKIYYLGLLKRSHTTADHSLVHMLWIKKDSQCTWWRSPGMFSRVSLPTHRQENLHWSQEPLHPLRRFRLELMIRMWLK